MKRRGVVHNGRLVVSETHRARYNVARERMPDRWPTHRCPAGFWEELGRTIATFGFLEDCLTRANLALTASREYESVEDAEQAFGVWERDLERSLDESLGVLIERFVRALSKDHQFREAYVKEIETKLHKIADWRNALCHGSWTDYDRRSEMATLRYWPRKGWREHSEQPISRENLEAICRDVVDITCRVIDAVTSDDIQFPGAEGRQESASGLLRSEP